MKIPQKHPDRINDGILLEIYRQYEKDEVVMLLMNEHKLLRIENGMLKSEYQEKIDGLVTQVKALEKKCEKLKAKNEEYHSKYSILYREHYKLQKP